MGNLRDYFATQEPEGFSQKLLVCSMEHLLMSAAQYIPSSKYRNTVITFCLKAKKKELRITGRPDDAKIDKLALSIFYPGKYAVVYPEYQDIPQSILTSMPVSEQDACVQRIQELWRGIDPKILVCIQGKGVDDVVNRITYLWETDTVFWKKPEIPTKHLVVKPDQKDYETWQVHKKDLDSRLSQLSQTTRRTLQHTLFKYEPLQPTGIKEEDGEITPYKKSQEELYDDERLLESLISKVLSLEQYEKLSSCAAQVMSLGRHILREIFRNANRVYAHPESDEAKEGYSRAILVLPPELWQVSRTLKKLSGQSYLREKPVLCKPVMSLRELIPYLFRELKKKKAAEKHAKNS